MGQNMADYKTRFQNILRELFQFDAADLDFGIYRLFAARREENLKWSQR
jgi:hypothetical protein